MMKRRRRADRQRAVLRDCSMSLLEPRRLLSASDLDLTFGDRGIASLPIGASGATGGTQTMAQQSDGKTIVAGSISHSPQDNVNFNDAFVARFNADGSVDTGFGTNGVTLIDVGENDAITDLTITSTGKIIASGSASTDNYLLVRLTSNGQIDTNSGFGGADGIATASGTITAIALSGTSIYAVGGDGVSRFDAATGAVDTTFASTAISISSITSLRGFSANDIAIRSDGKLLISGGAFPDVDLQPSDEDYVPLDGGIGCGWLVQLNTNGTVDNTFDHNSVQTLFDPAHADLISGGGFVALDASDHIFVEYTQSYRAGEQVLARFDPTDGHQLWQQTWSHPFNFESTPTGLGISSDGKIVIGRQGAEFRRYTAAGALDTSFGVDGEMEIYGSEQPIGGSFVVKSNGDLRVAGQTANSNLVLLLAGVKADSGGLSNLVHLTHTGTLVIDGTGVTDTFSVRRKENTIRIVAAAGFQNAAQQQVIYGLSKVKRFYINLGDDADSLTTNANIRQSMNVLGGGGNDSIITGSGNDFIDAGDGSDTVDGGFGADDMHGGSDAGEQDVITYATRTVGVNIILNSTADDGEAGEGDNVHDDFEIFVGGGGDDRMFGNTSANIFKGGGGADSILGEGGNDTLYGDGRGTGLANPPDPAPDGRDTLHGGDGNDSILGGEDRDRLYGDAGIDQLYGESGADWIYASGDGANDVIHIGHYKVADLITKDAGDLVQMD